MTTTRLAVNESLRRRATIGWRRCEAAAWNEGRRCEGNLFGAVGSGVGVGKGGMSKSWK